jgi:hypothetical protein
VDRQEIVRLNGHEPPPPSKCRKDPVVVRVAAGPAAG